MNLKGENFMKTRKCKTIKLLSAFLAVIMLFSIFACAPFTVSAEEVYGKYKYEYFTSDGQNLAAITSYTGKESNLVIPSVINGYEVCVIADSAFVHNYYLESVSIPESVIAIGDYAFAGCSNLEKISIHDNVVLIGMDTFHGTAYADNSKNWYNDVLYVGKHACDSKDAISKISLKQGTVGIASALAYYNNNLKSFTIPDSVKYIGVGAAFECPNLPSITLPYGVERIDYCAFGFGAPDGNEGSPKKVNNFKIVGAKGTPAEEYAKGYGFKFVDGSTAKSMTINRTSLTLGAGEKYTLIKSVSPSSASNCKWSSSNNGVAVVDQNGTVTAKNAGTATITVKTASGMSKTCIVTVKPAPSSIKVSTNNLTLGIGEEYIISESTNTGSYAWKFGWSSSDTKVATVTKTSGNKAKIVAKGTGTAYITVKTYNGKSTTCKVNVKSAPTSVTLSNSNIILGKGETFIISQNSNSGSYAKSFTWSSSNSNVATIEKTSGNKAKITAKTNGTATITFKTYNGITATCKVTVKNAPTSVKTNPASVTLGVGETYTVSESTNSGTYANAENLKWSSTNTSVATVVKESGNKAQIVAKGVGTAYVKITLYNGKTAQCKVIVKPAPTSVKLNVSELMLKTGDEFIIAESTNSGSYANSANLKWESLDSNIASVTKLGANKAKVTAKGTGVATIKLTTYNGKVSFCTVYVNTTKADVPEDDVQVESSPIIIDDETEIIKETVLTETE